ncbi:hypothetical protein FOVSG1_005030 [Fusarium oxysporum f. sp. vasinfectum]
MFIAGRFFAGIGVGMISAMIPLYQSETAPKWIRGVIIGAYQWAITIGLLLAAVINNTTSMRNNTGSYRIPVAVQFAWSLVLCFGMLVLPKPPRFLIKKDQLEKAACSLGESAVFHPITLPWRLSWPRSRPAIIMRRVLEKRPG